MKKNILFVFVIMFMNLSFAQTSVEIKGETKYSCSQKYGMTETEGSYILNISYDEENLKFSTASNQKMTSYAIAKKTNKYVIGKNKGDNYSFFDIKNDQFFYIDFYSNRYITAGYGKSNSKLKQSVLKMIEMLKNGKTQQDVIHHLIEQTEYDF